MFTNFGFRQFATQGGQALNGGLSKDALIRCPEGGGAVVLKDLHILAKKNKEKPFKGLIYRIADPNTLVLAYEQIKSKPGNMNLHTNRDALDQIQMDFIHKISRDLLEGKFKFKSAGEVLIDKPGNIEKCPNFREKVV